MKSKKCMDNLANCFCWQKPKHKGLHKCRCGGSWDDSKFPHSFPDISAGIGAFPLTVEEEDLLRPKKKRGRPPGSKNKKRVLINQYELKVLAGEWKIIDVTKKRTVLERAAK